MTKRLAIRYYNPQEQTNGGRVAAAPIPITPGSGPGGALPAWVRRERCETPNVDDVKNQIEAVYAALTAVEDLEEAEPGKFAQS